MSEEFRGDLPLFPVASYPWCTYRVDRILLFHCIFVLKESPQTWLYFVDVKGRSALSVYKKQTNQEFYFNRKKKKKKKRKLFFFYIYIIY